VASLTTSRLTSLPRTLVGTSTSVSPDTKPSSVDSFSSLRIDDRPRCWQPGLNAAGFHPIADYRAHSSRLNTFGTTKAPSTPSTFSAYRSREPPASRSGEFTAQMGSAATGCFASPDEKVRRSTAMPFSDSIDDSIDGREHNLASPVAAAVSAAPAATRPRAAVVLVAVGEKKQRGNAGFLERKSNSPRSHTRQSAAPPVRHARDRAHTGESQGLRV
jgi:hypothetical protein